MKLTNEAFRLKLSYGACEPEQLSSLCAARRDKAAFQMIVNSDRYYCLSVGCAEWYSSVNRTHMIGAPIRIRAAIESPFESTVNIEEFVTDDDEMRKADIILAQDVRESAANVPSALWCEINIPEDAEPGEYTLKAKLFAAGYNDDETLVACEEIKLTVYPYVLPEHKDWKFHLDLWQHNSNIARKHDVRIWSDEHFEVVKKYAKSLADLGQKTVMVCVSEIPWNGQTCFKVTGYGGNLFEYNIIGITRELDGSFTYDYSKLQKYIDICTEAGITGDIEMIGLVNVWGGDDSKILGTEPLCSDHTEQLRLRYFDKADGCLKYMRSGEHMRDYIKALETYMITTGQIGRARVGADEPGDMERYRESVALIRKIAPAFRFKTAINHAEFIAEFGEVIDDFAPYIRCATKEYATLINYKTENPQKKLLWYVCCGRSQPNTFIRSDLVESRAVGLLTNVMRFDGFLRWNYTVWPNDPRKDIRFESFEAGDTNFVYPAYNGDVLLSLRYKNLQRGIVDYELFEKLREVKGDAVAEELLSGLIDAMDMSEYYNRLVDKVNVKPLFSHDWNKFNEVKKQILQMLS